MPSNRPGVKKGRNILKDIVLYTNFFVCCCLHWFFHLTIKALYGFKDIKEAKERAEQKTLHFRFQEMLCKNDSVKGNKLCNIHNRSDVFLKQAFQLPYCRKTYYGLKCAGRKSWERKRFEIVLVDACAICRLHAANVSKGSRGCCEGEIEKMCGLFEDQVSCEGFNGTHRFMRIFCLGKLWDYYYFILDFLYGNGKAVYQINQIHAMCYLFQNSSHWMHSCKIQFPFIPLFNETKFIHLINI